MIAGVFKRQMQKNSVLSNKEKLICLKGCKKFDTAFIVFEIPMQ